MAKTPRTAAAKAPVALVSGASAGIGEALARGLARAGHRLVLVARREDRLQALAAALKAEHGTACTVIAADLAERGAPAALAAALAKRRIAVDVLVNNAGVLEQGAFTAIGAGRHARMVDLNVAALTAMLDAFVPAMVRRGRGRVLNVASIAAFQPLPSLAVYAASKAYVLSLSEALAEELRPHGVSVTALCPGITATGMLEAAAAHNRKLAQLPDFVVGSVDEVAAEGLRACLAGEAICVPGLFNKTATLAARAAPKWLLRRVAGALGRSAI